jgi:hypothetical protein
MSSRAAAPVALLGNRGTLSVATLKGTRECENALGGSLSVRNFVVAVVFSDRAMYQPSWRRPQVPRVVIFVDEDTGTGRLLACNTSQKAPLSWVWAEHRP